MKSIRKRTKALSGLLCLVVTIFCFSFSASAAETQIDIGSYLDPAKWVTDDGDVTINSSGITFNNAMRGDFAAIKAKEEQTDVCYKFKVKLEEIPTDLSETAGTWWDSEFMIMLRGKVAGSSSKDGQAGYCLTTWGDMSTVYIGKSGKDDMLTPQGVAWTVNDGKEHVIEFSAVNNADKTAVDIKLVVDGKAIFEGADSKANFTGAGSLVVRSKYVKATLTAAGSTPETETPKSVAGVTTVASQSTSTTISATTAQAGSPVVNQEFPFYGWIIIAAVVIVAAGAVTYVIIKKKKKPTQ